MDVTMQTVSGSSLDRKVSSTRASDASNGQTYLNAEPAFH